MEGESISHSVPKDSSEFLFGNKYEEQGEGEVPSLNDCDKT
jgi:hypothetical protein